MILNSLFKSKNNIILKKLLDYSALNHKVIANNIANVETPGFTAKKLKFDVDKISKSAVEKITGLGGEITGKAASAAEDVKKKDANPEKRPEKKPKAAKPEEQPKAEVAKPEKQPKAAKPKDEKNGN